MDTDRERECAQLVAEAFHRGLALLLHRLAHEPDLRDTGLLQQHHRLVDAAVIDALVACDEERELRVLAHERRHFRDERLRLDRLAFGRPEREEQMTVLVDADDRGLLVVLDRARLRLRQLDVDAEIEKRARSP